MASRISPKQERGALIQHPYRPGQHMGFQLLENYRTPLTDDAYIAIDSVLSITMSPVMNVTIIARSGWTMEAVLKVYDRRFGVDLRSPRRNYAPCHQAHEQAFRSFVTSEKMKPFLDELDRSREDPTDPIKPSYFYDYGDDDDDDEEAYRGPDGVARYETALWQATQDYFACETKAYQHLAEFQGKLIPRLCGLIRLSPLPGQIEQAEEVEAVSEQLGPYLEVKGILLERINGYSLWDLPDSPLAPQDPSAWSSIVQAAVDASETINRHGIMMGDAAPRNVIVDQHSQTPFIIDLAQCFFKEETVTQWEGLDAEEKAGFQDRLLDTDWVFDAEAEWWHSLGTTDNAGAIGAVMATRVRRETGTELKLQYPKFYKISSAIRRRVRESRREA